MDIRRWGYYSHMQANATETFKVRWLRCQPGAQPPPFSHAFGSSRELWMPELTPAEPVGEIYHPHVPGAGFDESQFPGDHVCGGEYLWKHGWPVGTPPLPVRADGTPVCCGGPGMGVEQVGLSLPIEFIVSGSPVFASGTLAGVWREQAPGLFLASPGNGAPGIPRFRGIETSDLGRGTADDTTFLRGDLTWAAAGSSSVEVLGGDNVIVVEAPTGTFTVNVSTYPLSDVTGTLPAGQVGSGYPYALLSGAPAPTPPNSLLDGLVAYWTCSETIGTRADQQATYPLLDVGTNPTLSAPGLNGLAASLDKTQVNILQAASLIPLSVGEAFTYAGWLFLDGSAANTFFANGDVSYTGKGGVQINDQGAAGYVFFQVQASDDSFSTAYIGGLAGSWIFVRGWYDPADQKVRLKVNETGLQVGTALTAPLAFLAGGAPVCFTKSGALGTFLAQQIGVWNRVLTDDEGVFLFNGGAGRPYPFTPNPTYDPHQFLAGPTSGSPAPPVPRLIVASDLPNPESNWILFPDTGTSPPTPVGNELLLVNNAGQLQILDSALAVYNLPTALNVPQWKPYLFDALSWSSSTGSQIIATFPPYTMIHAVAVEILVLWTFPFSTTAGYTLQSVNGTTAGINLGSAGNVVVGGISTPVSQQALTTYNAGPENDGIQIGGTPHGFDVEVNYAGAGGAALTGLSRIWILQSILPH
jgi:hypothetical protein